MKLRRVLFIPDSHLPDVDPRAFQVMLDVAQDFKPHEVVYLGDFFDAKCVSSYEKDPLTTVQLLEEELIPGREAMDKVERITKAKKFTFLCGNHESRVERYINENAPALARASAVRDILKVPDYYRFLPYGQKGHYRIGNWVITHGTLCGKHVAAAMVHKYGCNVLFGHVHRIQRYQVTNFAGDIMTGLTCGWLGDKVKAAEYIKNVADWAHGFALGYFKPSGSGSIETISIEKYQAIALGTLYKS